MAKRTVTRNGREYTGSFLEVLNDCPITVQKTPLPAILAIVSLASYPLPTFPHFPPLTFSGQVYPIIVFRNEIIEGCRRASMLENMGMKRLVAIVLPDDTTKKQIEVILTFLPRFFDLSTPASAFFPTKGKDRPKLNPKNPRIN